MTVTEPLPSGTFGKADWVDYSNYWREADAEWIMERSILRYASAATRTAQWATPKFGMTTYNDATDRLEVYSRVAAAWATIQQFVNLKSLQDTAAGVAFSHNLAGGKGLIFEPTRNNFTNPIYVMGGVLTADATGVTIKTGAAAAKLTTDATRLVSDLAFHAPALSTGGALTANNITTGGTLTALHINMSGTLTGGVINGTSGTIGGVSHGGSLVNASAGYDTQGGSFYGTSNSAIVRTSSRSGAYVQVSNGTVAVGSGYFDVANTASMRVFTNGIQYIRADGTPTGWISPAFYGDPGVGNCPEGSILIQ